MPPGNQSNNNQWPVTMLMLLPDVAVAANQLTDRGDWRRDAIFCGTLSTREWHTHKEIGILFRFSQKQEVPSVMYCLVVGITVVRPTVKRPDEENIR